MWWEHSSGCSSLLAEGEGPCKAEDWPAQCSLRIPLPVAKPEPESAKPRSQAREGQHGSVLVARAGQHNACFSALPLPVASCPEQTL